MQQTGSSHGMVFLSAVCGPSQALAGRVQDALRLLNSGVRIARDLTGSGSCLGAIVGLPLAALLYECNGVESATRLMVEYFRNDPPVGMADQLIDGWITQA
jgi:hypothetical protein